jgi:KTSC domain
MERTPVNSSNIAAIGYDEDTQILEIEFTDGSVYQYSGVPPSEHDGIMIADSKGKYLHANIKKRYSYVKL